MAEAFLDSYTRQTRKSLLTASAVSIGISLFNLEIEDIPFIGIKISFSPSLIPYFITSLVLYFTVAYLIRCIDDLTRSSAPRLVDRLRVDITKYKMEDICKYVDELTTSIPEFTEDDRVLLVDRFNIHHPNLFIDYKKLETETMYIALRKTLVPVGIAYRLKAREINSLTKSAVSLLFIHGGQHAYKMAKMSAALLLYGSYLKIRFFFEVMFPVLLSISAMGIMWVPSIERSHMPPDSEYYRSSFMRPIICRSDFVVKNISLCKTHIYDREPLLKDDK